MAVDPSEISVIVPLRYGDSADGLMEQLQGSGVEVIASREDGRAKSLNMGAAQAQNKFLWFLHADSFLPIDALEKLQNSLRQNEEALHYFDLEFANDGPNLMSMNAYGANLRSRLFGTPFGDQGFCLRKDLFFKIGSFPEDVKYGEDHLFVWHARRHGIKLHPVRAKIITSARTYGRQGWLRTTIRHQYLWIKQALPQYWLLIRGR